MRNIRTNSKNVKNGDAFIAIPCKEIIDHIEEAKRNKASLIFVQKPMVNIIPNTKEIVIVDDVRLLASRFARLVNSEQPEHCVAITGTNGKSSVAHFIRQFWTACGKRAANLGTVGIFIGDILTKKLGDFQIPNLTTPDSFTLHKILDFLKFDGISHFVFEASSHALHQKRLHSVSLSAAAFTNLESDHLDYHGTKDEYFSAKLRLFYEILDSKSPAIASLDYEDIYHHISKFNKNIISFGMSNKNYITVDNVQNLSNNTVFDLIIDGNRFKDIKIDLIGKFQLMNLMCAVGVSYCSGLSCDMIINALPKIRQLQGRMELIREINGIKVFIDYAHTSSALESVLSALVQICRGKLVCVFGCGGDRDKTKRIEMGKIAEKLAEAVIITDDNPRYEDPATIRSEIILGCKGAVEIGDRKAAIKFAIDSSKSGDYVIIIGKGHETTQIYGSTVLAHDDREEVLKYDDSK
ncbi:MAG: UDP-N-acetylmuramoyl-L-alanyl-D-glutamate--2,6-diaminopimelate ligase [Holosporales bacterium]|jgi:UDP-N-acetylmuramoyl-L-alanyl-D-glutamate--2,6-diaminopimelate ligase|nr:UDP-N-acetylmuramoyl-L-alanyl-D-glutamate--2,6-diaminopimelate ligase [Holosporales bacterium]